MNRLHKALVHVLQILGRIALLLLAFGVVYGFLDGRRKWKEAEARRLEELALAPELARGPFTADVIDPAGVQEYTDSQWNEIRRAADAIESFAAAHRSVPSGPDWQKTLIDSGFLTKPVRLATLPSDVTWTRARTPPPELFPSQDSSGAVLLILRAGGIDLAVFRNGEMTPVSFPVPEDAAMPRPETNPTRARSGRAPPDR